MTLFPDFIPIDETRGMSVVTAVVFFFYSIGFIFVNTMMWREMKRINETIEKHELKLTMEHESLNCLQTDVALLLQSVTRIEEMLKDKRRK